MQVHPEDVGVFFNSKIPSYTQIFHNEYDGFLSNQGFSSKNLHIDVLYGKCYIEAYLILFLASVIFLN